MITPPLPITDGDDPSTYVASTINHYQQYERKKFGGCSINTDNSYILREQVIAALNNSSTISFFLLLLTPMEALDLLPPTSCLVLPLTLTLTLTLTLPLPLTLPL
jgi:hypothetical protein